MSPSSSNLDVKKQQKEAQTQEFRIRVGRYELLYPIGHGGMATVYAGRLLGMAGFEKMVAVKVIHPHLADRHAFVDMFLDEARLAAKIHHPNVGEIFEVGEDEGAFFMVGELIQGQPLDAVIDRVGNNSESFSEPLAAHIVAKICRGLHAAHKLKDDDDKPINLIHRDVTPHNVMVSYDGFVKLIDFGIAWARDRLTQSDTGSLKGKVAFMSPEQFNGESLDPSSDIFSVGVMLYLLITGQHPFLGDSSAVRMQKIVSGQLKRPLEVNPDIDPSLDNIAMKALAAARSDRYSTADEMAQDLEAFVRTSEKVAASEVLSKLMRRLFADESKTKRKRLRLAEQATTKNLRAAAKAYASEQSNKDIETLTDIERPTTSVEEKKPSKRFVPIAALGGLVIVAILVMAVLGVFSGKTPQDEVQPPPPVVPPVTTEKPVEATPPDPITEEITVLLKISPENATLFLDGKELDPGTSEISIPKGEKNHTIEAKLKGYETRSEIFTADSDQRFLLELAPNKESKKQKLTPKPSSHGKRDEKSELLESPY